MMSGTGLLVLFASALLISSCAVSPVEQQRRLTREAQIDAVLLNAQAVAEPQRCLSDHQYRNFRALDDRRVLFEGRRGKLWINNLRFRCHDLRYATVLRVRSSIASMSNRSCDADTFIPGDWFDWPWYRRWPWQWGTWGTATRCSLGKFQPVTEADLQAIERAIRSR